MAFMRTHEKRFIILSLVGKSRDAKKIFCEIKKIQHHKGGGEISKKQMDFTRLPNELADQNYPILVKKAFREKKM